MNTKTATIEQSLPITLRLSNNETSLLPRTDTKEQPNEFSDSIDRFDTRWVFAARVQIALDRDQVLDSASDRHDLVCQAQQMGLSSMSAVAIFDVVENAQKRGGLDRMAMNSLSRIPGAREVESELSNRARWLVFGVLFGWALLIAAIMQVV
jgi:hypothetical protein